MKRSVTALAVTQRLLRQHGRGVRHHEGATERPRGTRWSRQSPRDEERRVRSECLAGLAASGALTKRGRVLGFAKYLLSDLSRLWTDLPLDQKQRLQRIVFPNGITFLRGEFGTAEPALFLNLLGTISLPGSNMVAPTGFEPVLPP